jgi:hypothetical protein
MWRAGGGEYRCFGLDGQSPPRKQEDRVPILKCLDADVQKVVRNDKTDRLEQALVMVQNFCDEGALTSMINGTSWILRRHWPQRTQGTWAELRARAIDATKNGERSGIVFSSFHQKRLMN